MARDDDSIPVGRGERVTVSPDDDRARTSRAQSDTTTTSRPVETRTVSRSVEPVRREYRDDDPTRDAEIPEGLNLSRDRVRWGPIMAGFLTALTSLLLLSLLGLAIGLTTVNAGEAAAQGGAPADTGRNSAIWGGISAIVAFLLGGYVAGKTSAVFNRNWGALNGALVFMLAVPFTLWLAGQGLGAILGTLGSFASSLNADPGQTANAAQNVAGQAQQAAQNVQPIDVARAAERARNGAWGTLLGSLLGLGSSALGGYLGTRREVEVDRRTGAIAD